MRGQDGYPQQRLDQGLSQGWGATSCAIHGERHTGVVDGRELRLGAVPVLVVEGQELRQGG